LCCVKEGEKGGEMIRRRKVGILLILIGIGIPLVLFFFQNRKGDLTILKPKFKTEHREKIYNREMIPEKLTPAEVAALDIIELYKEKGKPLTPEQKKLVKRLKE